MLHHVTIGIFEIDEDDIGLQRLDGTRDPVHLMDNSDATITGFAQPLFNDGGADRVFV
ncbi:hypothetical protein D3C86_1620010 [compost metagenome]